MTWSPCFENNEYPPVQGRIINTILQACVLNKAPAVKFHQACVFTRKHMFLKETFRQKPCMLQVFFARCVAARSSCIYEIGTCSSFEVNSAYIHTMKKRKKYLLLKSIVVLWRCQEMAFSKGMLRIGLAWYAAGAIRWDHAHGVSNATRNMWFGPCSCRIGTWPAAPRLPKCTSALSPPKPWPQRRHACKASDAHSLARIVHSTC